MKTVIPAYRIFPLGDSALTIDFGNVIDKELNKWVIQLFHAFSRQPLPGMIEAVPAYSSLTIYFDLFTLRRAAPESLAFEQIRTAVEERLAAFEPSEVSKGRVITIPVCYHPDFAPDLAGLAAARGLPVEEVIRLHTGGGYQVYMLGFLPGFSYLGDVDERISMQRKQQPVPVAAGSVGIAGRQTGIYPLASPGGWQIIGRTPLRMFDPGSESPTLLRQGDRVQFTSISKNEFANY